MTHLHIPQKRYLTELPDEVRRAAPASQRVGYLVSQDSEGGPALFIDVIQCCHCERVWPFVKGSGNVRGWCMQCGKITCGNDDCDVCVPREQLLQNMAAGMPFHQARKHRPIVASVPNVVPAAKPKLILGRA